jgi:hypothetical protein
VDEPAPVADVFAEASLAPLLGSGPVDVAVGVHVVNQARHVEEVLEAAAAFVEPADSTRVAVLVADAGSRDGTPDTLRSWRDAATSVPRCVVDVVPPKHRGRAVLALLRAAHRLGARALVLLDADLSGVPPSSLRALVEPVLRADIDYVSPAYSRTVSEGTLTTNLLAPLTRALYGAGLQQVMGGCAALSGRIVASVLSDGGETGPWQPYGALLWLTTAVLAANGRIAEVSLGRKTVTPGGAVPDLATILLRAVGPLFALMERYETVWQDRTGGLPVARQGEPPPIEADARNPAVEQMVHAFNLGLKDLLPVWEQIMPEATLARLYPLALLSPEEFSLPPALWARVVSDFAVAHHERRLPRDHLLRSLTPLYLGRVAAFIGEARATPLRRIPETFEKIDRAFEAEKEHLVARWR